MQSLLVVAQADNSETSPKSGRLIEQDAVRIGRIDREGDCADDAFAEGEQLDRVSSREQTRGSGEGERSRTGRERRNREFVADLCWICGFGNDLEY